MKSLRAFIVGVFLTVSANFQDKAVNAVGVQWNTLRVKFTLQKAGEFPIPLTYQDGNKEDEYETLAAHNEFPLVTIRCMKGDPRVCPMYDKNKKLCGLRLAYPKDDLNKKAPGGVMPYDYKKIACFKEGEEYGIPLFYTDILLDSPDSLEKGGTPRSEPAGSSLWFRFDGKTWTQIPRKEADITKNPVFIEQNCFDGMGQHYFYKVEETSNCNEMIPFFALYQDGELIGCGTASFGSFTNGPERNWLENVPVQIVPGIFKNYPQCLTEYVETYGALGLHLYMTDEPIKCPKKKIT